MSVCDRGGYGLLNGEIFYTFNETKIMIEAWRRHYNTAHPHSLLGYRPPALEVVITRSSAYPVAPMPGLLPVCGPGARQLFEPLCRTRVCRSAGAPRHSAKPKSEEVPKRLYAVTPINLLPFNVGPSKI